MPRWTVNSALVLLMLLNSVLIEQVRAARRGRSRTHALVKSTAGCNFDKNSKNYTPTDLLQCLNSLASEDRNRSPNIDLSSEGRANKQGRTFISSNDQSSDFKPRFNGFFLDKFMRSLASLMLIKSGTFRLLTHFQ
ncbi:hypothetical protein TKK_0018228 [Trichogramma kaykai]